MPRTAKPYRLVPAEVPPQAGRRAGSTPRSSPTSSRQVSSRRSSSCRDARRTRSTSVCARPRPPRARPSRSWCAPDRSTCRSAEAGAAARPPRVSLPYDTAGDPPPLHRAAGRPPVPWSHPSGIRSSGRRWDMSSRGTRHVMPVRPEACGPRSDGCAGRAACRVHSVHDRHVPRARPGLLRRTFRSLRVYNYRLFFFSQVVSMSGTWMQSVAQNWLVLSLTSSALDLGITVGLQFGPVLLFGAWGGTLADRVDKRKLLILTQVAAAVLAAGARRPRGHRRRHRVDDLGARGAHRDRDRAGHPRPCRASSTRWSGPTTSPTPSASTPS